MIKLPRFPRLKNFKNPIPKKWRRAFAIVSALAIIAGAPGAYLLLRNPASAEAAWFNYNWGYRQMMTITNGSGSVQTNFQIKMAVSTSTLISAGKMQTSCADIRITDSTGKVLPYWIETGTNACNTTTTAIWVKVPNIPTTPSKIYLYYGNASAQTAQNGKTTFDFFDDFSGSAIDSAIWNNSGGSATVTAGELLITTGAIYSRIPILTNNQNELVEMRVKWAPTQVTNTGIAMSNQNNVQGNNAGSNKMNMLVTNAATSIANVSFAGDGTAASYNITSAGTQFTPTANTYTFSGMAFDATSSATLHYYGNRVQTSAYTDTASYTPYLILGMFTGANAAATDVTDMTVDFVLSRKYASTEPTLSAAAEEIGASAVGYWKFNEGTGQTVNDSSKTLNAGTLGATSAVSSDDPTWIGDEQCINSKCLYFDGSNDSVLIPANAAQNVTESTPFTISGWFRTSTIGGTPALIAKYSSTTDMLGWILSLSTTNQVSFTLIKQPATLSSSTSTQTLNLNQWYYLTGEWDGTNIKVFINGAQAATSTLSFSGSTQGTQATYVGSTLGAANWYSGFAEEIKYYTYARTTDQLKADMILGQSTIGNSSQQGAAIQSVLTNGLTSLWKMDETSWTVDCSTGSVLDSSGNGLNAKSCPTGTGPAGGAPGKYGNAGLFDGTNDYVQTPTLSIDEKSYTASAWVKTTDNGDIKILSLGANDHLIAMTAQAARVCINSGCVVGTSLINDGNWHMITTTGTTAQTPSGTTTTVRLYVDGILEGQLDVAAITLSAAGYSGAASGGGIGGGPGNIGETRVYNRPFSPAEVAQLYNYAPSAIFRWNFEENRGGTVADSGLNGASPGTLTNGPLWVPGKYGSGLKLDAVNDYVTAGDSTVLEPPNDMTLSLWVNPSINASSKPNDIVYARKIHSISPFNSYQIYQQKSDNKVCFLWENATPAGFTVCSKTALSINNWYYLTGVRSGSKLYIYINGVNDSATSPTPTGVMYNSNGNIAFGDDTGGSKAFGGILDQIVLYNYARSSSQIIEDMNAGHPVAGSPLGSQAIYWPLDEMNGTTINNRGNLGSLISAAQSGAVWTPSGTCKVNGCLNFDTTSDNIAGGSPTFFDGLATMTVSFWINPTTLSSNSSYVSKFDGASNQFQIRSSGAGGDKLRVNIANAATDSANNCVTSAPLAITTGSWQYITVVYDGNAPVNSNIKVYKNGVLWPCTVSGTIPTALRTSTTTLRVNANAAGGAGITGLYDEVKIYAIALTQDQVNIDFNQGKAINYNIGTGLESAQVTGGTGTAPIGYWQMEEKNGATVLDKSGNENTGTTTAGVYKPGKYGSSVLYNGTTSRTVIANESNFDFERTSPLTISYWVKPNITRSGAATAYQVVSKRDNTGNTPGWNSSLVWDGTSKTFVRMALVSTATNYILTDGLIDVPSDRWSFIEMTYDGSSTAAGVKMYVNGVLDTNTNVTDTLSTSMLNNISLNFGSYNGALQFFPGQLDEVSIYNYARTKPQVAYDFNRGGPIGFWKFNECQGDIVYDSSGNSINGTLSVPASGAYSSPGTCGSGTSTQAWNAGTVGKYNSAIGLDVNDTINLGNNFSFNYTDPFSASVWFKTTTNSGMTLIAKQDTSAPYRGWNLQTGGSGFLYFQLVNTYCTAGNCLEVYYPFNSNYYDGNWHNFTATYDGSGSGTGVALYLDGKVLKNLSGTGGTITTTTTNALSTYIGSRNNVNQFFGGTIDDTRVYNYALSAEQVRRIYTNDFTAFYGPATGTP